MVSMIKCALQFFGWIFVLLLYYSIIKNIPLNFFEFLCHEINKSLYLSVNVFSTAVLIENTINKQTYINKDRKLLKIPTGRRQADYCKFSTNKY